MNEKKTPMQHIVIDNRESFSMTGVTEVESSDESTVKLMTNMGKLIIYGKNLSIGKISVETGDFSMNGEINKLEYRKSGKTSGRITSLFR